MAKMSTAGLELSEDVMRLLDRNAIRRIVEAGSRAAQQEFRNVIAMAGHVRNGDLMKSVAPGKLYESLDGATQIVKPQGTNPKGDLAEEDLAWILDNDPVKGDHYLTPEWEYIKGAGEEAMAEEADQILAELL